MSAVIPTLSREALKSNALAFANRWDGSHGEDAEAKSFLDEFFAVFGRDRRAVDARFEHAVKREGQGDGFIDLFWPGRLLVEMKSTGRDLAKAAKQAFEYIAHLDDPTEVPQFVMVSDFATIWLYDLGEHPHELFNAFKLEKSRTGKLVAAFPLADLPKHLRAFSFIRDEEQSYFTAEPGVNQRAVKLLGKLHDSIKADNFTGHALERFLVRILFCLFAEDTDIFQWNAFTSLVRKSKKDGSDLGPRLATLFQTLDTERRQTSLAPEFAAFPYINGGLFRERIDTPALTADQRTSLLDCCRFDWAQISPAVFGSLFQGVMLPRERREKGAHYTSETNIRKVIDPLFLDDLKTELQKLADAPPTKARERALDAYAARLATLRFLDPACGCGNFLVIAYRELRQLELAALLARFPVNKAGYREGVLNVADLIRVSVDQMYGIEIDEFPALIAETALWLTDHQVNMAVSKAFGQNFLRIPLRASATILHANALRTPWESVLPPDKCSFIMGNPPFIGAREKDKNQSADMVAVFGKHKGVGDLDYVGAWYAKATDYMAKNKPIVAALVSTNSITQGEQPGILWSWLRPRGVKTHFGYRTFKWRNEAAGNAAVHCIILGFGIIEPAQKRLWDSPSKEGEPTPAKAREINPYLVDAPFLWLGTRRDPISDCKRMAFGSMPNDAKGQLSDIPDSLRRDIEIDHPEAAAAILRPLIGSDEFINGHPRWCLWIDENNLALARQVPAIRERVANVKKKREESTREATQALADAPYAFGEIRQPAGRYLFVPRTSSENRDYIPMDFRTTEVIAGDGGLTIDGASAYDFGVLNSEMHMAWVRIVCGRLEMRYRYSATIVYNNYPWPTPTEKARAAVTAAAKSLLAVRDDLLATGKNYADLYDPNFTPAALRKAHTALDRAVDAAYGYKGAPDDAARTAFLFKLYEKLAAPLAPAPKPAKAAKAPKSPKAKPAAR